MTSYDELGCIENYQSSNSVKQVGVYRADVHRLNAGVTLFYPYAGFNNDRSDQGGIQV